MEIQPVEGNTQWLDGGAMFGNAPKNLWSQWLVPDALNRIHLSCRALLVQTDNGRNILFETGIGAFFEPKLKERYGVAEENHVLLENLKKVGLSDSDIDTIVLSHLHFDHAGGLLSAYGDGPPRLLFPNAKIYVGKQQYARALKPHIRERVSFVPVLNELLTQSGRMILVEGEQHPDLDFGVRFHYSHGHTIGLMLSEITTDSGPLVFVSDLIPGRAWIRLPITMGYDRYPELLVDEKKTLLEYVEKAQGRLCFTHDPDVAIVKVGRDDKGGFEPL